MCDRAGQGRARRAGQGRVEQGRAGYGRAGQGRVRQGRSVSTSSHVWSKSYRDEVWYVY